MENAQMILTVGILKGIQSQMNDTDVKYALNDCIDIYGKLLQGYELVKNELPASQPEEVPVNNIEEMEGGD